MIFIIADDLTGANDTGVQYRKNGFSTMVLTEYDEKIDAPSEDRKWFDGYDVLAINANSRQLSPDEAYRRIYRLAERIGAIPAEYIYKKMDSLLRGNPAAELDAVMDALQAEIALVVPSFPENGRKLINGILVAPNAERIDVVETFRKSSKHTVCNLTLDEVQKGPEFLAGLIERKRREGLQIFVADAASEPELKTIKRAARQITGQVIFCGSAGFAKQLSNQKKIRKDLGLEENSGGYVLVVAGSRRRETAVQLRKISQTFRTPIVTLDVSKAGGGGRERDEEIARCSDEILRSAREGRRLMILAVSSLFGGGREEHGLEPEDPGAVSIAGALGIAAEKIYRRIRFRGIISTGGDTSLQICRALQSKGIELYDEIAAGIPVGRMVGGEADGMNIITKSGGFGDGDALIQAVNYLDRSR